MRIAVLSTPFISTPPRDYGGTELVLSELTEGLVARGHDVTLFATGDSQTSAELRACYATAQWPPDPFTDLDHVSWALRQASQGGYDIVHVNSAAALAMARLCPGLRVVYTIHHPHEPRLSAFYGKMKQVQYVAISADQRSREPELTRCRVIHHGLDPLRYSWTERAEDYVCFVGRLAPEKGAHTAIDAARAAGVRIRVAGRVHPPDRPYGQQHLTTRLAEPHVEYLGAVGPAAKAPLLRGARALLAPITWDEPFGLILAEAMLSGCPVVAFPRGSVPELVEPGVTGFVVESVEEMAAVIAPGGPVDRINRRQCRARAVQRFSRSRLVADHERLYADVLEQAARAGRAPIAAA
ncbi:MAG TPA: glycosyltransferase family 4 protein [Gemmatimonadales bacterium]|jgi:glycosyltransferase involved in cell wall biosynthesis|nr:glycosyltransferase family 4 protein [Gemmatimonadales bacterium]